MATATVISPQSVDRGSALNGVAFTLTPHIEPETLDTLSLVDLDAKLQHSYEQSLAGEGRAYRDVFDELDRIDKARMRVYILNVIYNRRDQLSALSEI